jgi:hypothetical protein
VAKLIKHEAEQRPEQNPKVNLQGVEELIADRGCHSGAVLERMKGYEMRTYIPEKKQKGGGTGRAKASRSRCCTRIESECGASTARVCCGGGASLSSAASPTATRRMPVAASGSLLRTLE